MVYKVPREIYDCNDQFTEYSPISSPRIQCACEVDSRGPEKRDVGVPARCGYAVETEL